MEEKFFLKIQKKHFITRKNIYKYIQARYKLIVDVSDRLSFIRRKHKVCILEHR